MPFSQPSPDDAPTIDDVRAAVARLDGVAIRTPILESPLLNDRLGRRLLVKPECLQVTGSFKFRGASNKIRAMTEAERAGGVVAYSSGNHAQGVAAAARFAGIPAVIVMPEDAPAIKRENTKAWGAEVRLYSRQSEDRAAIAQAIAEERGAVLIRPFDDPMVIAGQGTVGLETAAQLDELGIEPTAAIVPCGGGGLLAGVSLALKDRWPDLPIFAAEPEDFDDTARSLEAGERLSNASGAHSICDALLSNTPGIITFEINRRHLSRVFRVSDTQALSAMATLFETLKLVGEPGGVTGLAAALEGMAPSEDGPILVVISGGNVDPEVFSRALA